MAGMHEVHDTHVGVGRMFTEQSAGLGCNVHLHEIRIARTRLSSAASTLTETDPLLLT